MHLAILRVLFTRRIEVEPSSLQICRDMHSNIELLAAWLTHLDCWNLEAGS